mgnify:FL=1
MSQYEFESNNEGEWDENGDIAWNEADWQKFLRKSDKEVSRFISAYNKSKNDPDRLDSIAGIMGWQNEDWASIDDIELDDEQMRQLKPLDIEEVRHLDPYTIHRHPIDRKSVV